MKMIGRLPVRPLPMRRRPDPDRPSHVRRLRFGHRPLSLVFRRPPTAQAPPPPAAGSPIEVSVHFAVLCHWADRLRLVVQRATAPEPLPPIALHMPTPQPVASAPLPPAPRPDPAGLRLAWPDRGPEERGPGVVGGVSDTDRTVIRIVRLIERTLHRVGAAVVTGTRRSARPGLAAGPPLARVTASAAASPAPVRALLRGPDGADLGPEPTRRLDRARAGRARAGAEQADVLALPGTPGRAPRRPIGAGSAWSRAEPRPTGPTGPIGSGAAAARMAQAGTIRRLRTPQAGPDPHPTTSEPRPLARRILLHRRPGAPDPLAVADRAIRPMPSPVPDEVVVWATRPVTRIHRTAPEAPAGPRGRSGAPDAAAGQRAPSPPPFDLDQLDRDLWRRFEKRIRVEQQRRGRG